MSLIKPAVPPPLVIRALTAGLGNFVEPNSPLWSLLLRKHVAVEGFSLILSEVRRIFEPTELYTLAPPKAPSLVIPTGWRFLAADGDLYGACHVGTIKANVPPILTGFSDGAEVLSAVESWNGLYQLLPLLPPGTFEPRILRIPWLQLEAFWLYPTDRPEGRSVPEDQLVPYLGFVEKAGLQLMQPYGLKDFVIRILPFVHKIYARSLAEKASGEEARARATFAQASAQRVGADALEVLAREQKERADRDSVEAARAQVAADINHASARQIADALELTSGEADEIVNHGREVGGYKGFTDLRQEHQAKLSDKQHVIGFGPRR